MVAAVPATRRRAAPMSSASLTMQHQAAMSSTDATVITGMSVTDRVCQRAAVQGSADLTTLIHSGRCGGAETATKQDGTGLCGRLVPLSEFCETAVRPAGVRHSS